MSTPKLHDGDLVRSDVRQVARELGVAISTVSRALNGAADVSARTRERVLRKAEELGYAPNAAGRRLRLRRLELVGFLHTPPADRLADPIYLDLLLGLGDALAARGLDLSIHLARAPADELGRLRRMVEGGAVDAVVLARTRPRDSRILYLEQRRIRFATFGRSELDHPYRHLDIDNGRTARLATRLLLDSGYRRPALMLPQVDLSFARHAEAGYVTAMTEAHAAEAMRVLRADFSVGSAQVVARRALAAGGCDSFVAASDAFAAGVFQAAAELCRTVGHDLGVVGFGANALLGALTPGLTTFRVPALEAGRRLADLLLRDDVTGEVMDAELVLGRSHLRALVSY